MQPLRQAAEFRRLLDRVMTKPWVVHSKPPFGGPVQVLKYLARYTHRVAIGNRRILAVDDSGVTFRWRDRANANRSRTMKLSGVAFLRRFLQHVLPRGFPRIRHYGLLGNRKRATKLAACRLLLGAPMPTPSPVVAPYTAADHRCPACRSGQLHRRPWSPTQPLEFADTS